MIENIDHLKKEFDKEMEKVLDSVSLESVRIKYIGRKSGLVSDLLKEITKVPPDKKGEFGKKANALKNYITDNILKKTAEFEKKKKKKKKKFFDITLPGINPKLGSYHPIELVQRKIEDIFLKLGYSVIEGPEAEDDWHNFEALNIPPHHPARDMQDTFYLDGGLLLRTHTSPMQIKTMENEKPPVRIICPGRTFRVDWDITHTPNFYQVEGLLVDIGVTLGDLIGTINHFCRELFSTDTKTRFRPSYFPFVEPGAEVDIQCIICKGKGCRTCKNSGWLEIMGAGMVHVNVLENVGYDSEIYTGFAFGMGMDRIAMLKYGIDDTRLNFESNLRFLDQFKGVL